MTDEELGLRKLNTPRLVAPTLKGREEIVYELLHHRDGGLYVRIMENSGPGGLSKYRFELKSVLEELDSNAGSLRGIAPDGITQEDTNRNSRGFVQAAVLHLLGDTT